jgi:hypothetical protein
MEIESCLLKNGYCYWGTFPFSFPDPPISFGPFANGFEIVQYVVPLSAGIRPHRSQRAKGWDVLLRPNGV